MDDDDDDDDDDEEEEEEEEEEHENYLTHLCIEPHRRGEFPQKSQSMADWLKCNQECMQWITTTDSTIRAVLVPGCARSVEP